MMGWIPLVKQAHISECVNIRDKDGVAALHHICYGGMEDCLQHIVKAKAIQFDIPDLKQYTPQTR